METIMCDNLRSPACLQVSVQALKSLHFLARQSRVLPLRHEPAHWVISVGSDVCPAAIDVVTRSTARAQSLDVVSALLHRSPPRLLLMPTSPLLMPTSAILMPASAILMLTNTILMPADAILLAAWSCL